MDYTKQCAFGTAGITSISGTNLYGCNWGRMVETFPDVEKNAARRDMAEFETRISGLDLMKRSQLQGEYAKQKILAHLPEYCLFTAKRHPRLYAGTGTVAMLRYLGLERTCDALDAMWGPNNARGFTPLEKQYSFAEKALGGTLQVLCWIVLLIGYVLVSIGIVKGIGNMFAPVHENKKERLMIVICPILSLLLLAVVIGPITATRYRFIMIPFFAMLAGLALTKSNPRQNDNA